MYTRISRSGGRSYLQIVESFRTDTGADFDTDTANVEVARCCTLAGVPVVPLSGLRHPSWSR